MKTHRSLIHRRAHWARRLAAASALLAAFLVPAAAHADSILYIDGGNVWSSHPDGSAKIQLTDGGDWHSPTQADDGTFAAVEGAGNLVQLFTRDGRPLHTIATVGTKSGDGGTFAPRPVNLALTPDGSRLAYSYVAASCPPGSSCGTIQRATMYTETNVTEATPLATYGVQRGVSDPEWITNDRALVFGGYLSQVDIDPLGGGDDSFTNWMRPSEDMGDGELSRDMTRMATTWDYGARKIIVFWVVNGDPRSELPPPQPDEACETTPDQELSDPSWSTDGSGVAYHAADGLHVVRFASFRRFAEGSCKVASEQVIAATGSEPDWGPAEPPAARWSAATGPGSGPGNGPASGKSIKLSLAKVSLGKALAKGLKLKVDAPAAGPIKAVTKVRGTVVASGRAKAKAAGACRVKLGFTRAARQALRHRRSVALQVVVTQGQSKATARISLKR